MNLNCFKTKEKKPVSGISGFLKIDTGLRVGVLVTPCVV